MSTRRVIAVVGAGFSGTALAARLLQEATEPLLTLLIEREAEIGRGLAYARAGYPYPLNVRPAGMSATGDPRHFRDYVRRRHPELDADGFLPRELYGDYLQWLLDDTARRAAPGIVLQRVRGEVVDIETAGPGVLRLCLADGQMLHADQAVLATGFVRGSGFTTHGVPGDSLLTVGTGLTMVDTVMEAVARNPRITVHALSRHGLLPLRQAPTAEPARINLQPVHPAHFAHSARGLISQVRRLAKEALARGADWREVINLQLRPQLPEIWSQLPVAERVRFLRHARSYWDVHRHRMPAEVAARLDALRASGQLQIHAGRIHTIRTQGGAVEVRWRPRGGEDNRTITVAQVVDCSGPSVDPARGGDVLWSALIRRGWATADALGQGVATGAHGELIGSADQAQPGLFYVGPLLRASHWEATAVAELQTHVARTAAALLQRERDWAAAQRGASSRLVDLSSRRVKAVSTQARLRAAATGLPLENWLEGLAAELHGNAESGIARYLARHRVTSDSLERWRHFDPGHYTRSLLYQSTRWQCVLMCWNPAQRTFVHDHNGLPAWISLMEGRLSVRNFLLRRGNPRHSLCELEEVEGAVLDVEAVDGTTEAEAGIHEVCNSSGGAGRAVSIHIYGRPMSDCGVFDIGSGAYRRVPLRFDRDLRSHLRRPATQRYAR